ncbi:NAD(P)/FAD-dependent oxidoreductase [Aeromicrobium terrae]|uniref:NAD(P)/FAD-dependent oxidoreductase n=1 Tax=Aeromicrobium terrae TaxID=2498846 RepID=A0A5C8NKY1_9ACTN|nr:NAD(P)/FAD-dependent oxidoreductase [Aeromicrobium terrae]TXL61810.1 NAD(P)/FAD-dependent oxidoreductase [Aeromicrobium terrae]
MHDTLVIGGGPAGLQAALTLGRMHRDVLLLDSGEYRNATVEHLQNFITHDGRDPAELRALARKDVAAYATVSLREGRVDTVRQTEEGFEAVLGAEDVSARTLVLATGVRDTLPDVPGVQEAWGREIAHCPFCHGHEFAGQRVVLLGESQQSEHLSGLLAGIVGELVTMAQEDVVRVERTSPGLRVHRADETVIEAGGMFVATQVAQAAPFAEQLGLDLLPSGAVEIDATGHTSLPGVFAAGDMAHAAASPPMASIMTAAAAGMVAGAMCHMELATR